MEPKHQVFVSSTFQDLQNERRVVMEQILNMGNIPVGMELFQAANDSQWNYIKRRIQDSDYFIVIIAERYGSVDGTGKSFTRREYEFALECGVPVAAFLLADAARQTWPSQLVEHNRRSEVDSFRALTQTRYSALWSDARDLAIRAGLSLAELIRDCPRPGWIKADAVKFSALKENAPGSKEASLQLTAAVERDLGTAGYYRQNQLLDIHTELVSGVLNIVLNFEATIIPVRPGAFVFRPEVSAPTGAKLTDCKYTVGDIPIGEGSWLEIDNPTKDNLVVRYEVVGDEVISVADYHYWPSPVLKYVVRFGRSNAFTLEVGKTTGRRVPDQILPIASGQYSEFVSKSAALTAQGLKWKLSRVNGQHSSTPPDRVP
jgi:hypothetical protein